jgi:hypothetical protein
VKQRQRPKDLRAEFSGASYLKGEKVSTSKKRRDKISSRTRLKSKIRTVARLVFILGTLGFIIQISFVRDIQVSVSGQLQSSTGSQIDGGGDSTIAGQVEQTITDSLDEKWWGRITPFINIDRLKEKNSFQYPQLSQLVINRRVLMSQIRVDSNLRQPKAIWMEEGDNNFLVDQNGILYRDDKVVHENLLKITEVSPLEYNSGDEALTIGMLNFILDLDTELKRQATPISILSYVVPETPREIDIALKDKPFIIKITSTRQVKDQVKELMTMLSYLKSNSINPLKYIDLRINDTAYYK